MRGAISGNSILHSRISCRVMMSFAVGADVGEGTHGLSERILLAADL